MTLSDSNRGGFDRHFFFYFANDERCLTFLLVILGVDQIKVFSEYALSGSWLTSTVGYIQITAYVVIFFICFIPIFLKNSLLSIVIYTMASVVIAFSFIYGQAKTDILKWKTIYIFLLYIPLFICFTSINDAEYVLIKLQRASFILLVIPTITLLERFFFGDLSNGRMSASYSMVFPLILLINRYYRTRHLFSLVIATIEFLILLIYGSRGAVVCIAAFIIMKIYSKLNMKKFIIITLLIAMFLTFFDKMMSYIGNLNVNSRTLQMILSNGYAGIFETGGRSELDTYYFSVIKDNYLLGSGITGAWPSTGEYPHNLFLELLVSFGCIFGALASIVYMKYMLKTSFMRGKIYPVDELKQVVAASSLSLLFSGTFLSNEYWYVFWGLIIASKKLEKGM